MKKTVGIIGAGAAGICAARRCHERGYKVVVFEQTNEVGGTWVYHPETGTHSSLYEKMNTNLPKEVMLFDDFPFPDYDNSGVSFVPHQHVLRYLKDFSEPIRHLILFNHKVDRVDRKDEKWRVFVSPSQSNGHPLKEFIFDVLFVCNGHYFDPYIPEFADKYRGKFLHSHDYRVPDQFTGKTVAIVGAGPSGADICLQAANVANKVYLLHKGASNCLNTRNYPENVTELTRAIDADEESLVLNDGKHLSGLDYVVFCTGYRYAFPFFKHSEILKPISEYVSPLYMHMVHVNYPESLFFIGMPLTVLPFILFEYQIKYAIALMEGKAEIPTREEFEEENARKIVELENSNTDLKYYHFFGDNMWDHFRQLAKLADVPYSTPPVIEKIYSHSRQERGRNVGTYKSNLYRIVDEEDFEFTYVGKPVYD